MWVSPDQTFIAVFQPNDEPSYSIETSPLVLESPTSELTFAVRCSQRQGDIFLNGKHVATNRDNVTIDCPITIPAPPTVELDFDPTAANDDCRRKRAEEIAKLSQRANRRKLTFDEQLDQLRDGCKELDELTHLLAEPKPHFHASVSARIRALICRFDRGPSYPLLQRIAGQLDLPLILYAPPFSGLNKDHPIAKGLSLSIDGMVTPEKIDPVQVPLDIDFWLTLKQATIDGVPYSNNEILRAIADTSGSHHDSDADPLVYKLNTIKVSRFVESTTSIILQAVSECVVCLAKFVIERADKT